MVIVMILVMVMVMAIVTVDSLGHDLVRVKIMLWSKVSVIASCFQINKLASLEAMLVRNSDPVSE